MLEELIAVPDIEEKRNPVSSIKELFEKERSYIDHFFDKIDLDDVSKIFNALRQCKGTLFFSGVGKSGYIAEKIAVTLTSTGTGALYLPPLNALHGDIGIVKPGDIFIMFSKSGESDELLEMIPYLRNRGATLIAVTSNAGSRLNKSCHLAITLPLENELCPFGIAPTTSTAIQTIFGDILIVSLMEAKSFSLAQYALNHPAGRIGKRITVKVEDIMIRGEQIPLCKQNDKVVDILVELSRKKCGCILVVDEDRQLLGIFTDGDLRRGLQERGPEVLTLPLERIMTKTPKTITPQQLAFDALKVMEANQNNPIAVLPVIDTDGIVHGIIRMHDIVQSGI